MGMSCDPGTDNVTTQRRFTVHLLPEPEGGFTVRAPALPPVVTYGETLEEALANAREAIEAVLEVYREEGIEIPADIETRVETLTIAA
jgi:predicted RNase H-like HicB family nuclease